MVDISTPNLGLTKPDVGHSDDTWGEKLNINFDIIDLLKAVRISDTPPTGVADNTFWWNSATGKLYVRYNDGNSSQWVMVTGGAGGSGSTDFDSISPTTTRGDIIYRNAIQNTRLPAGTSGFHLQTEGNGADPKWTGFLQSGTGAVERTWQNKGREIVSATDFAGVDPTGTADSTVGLQAWIDYCYINLKAGRLPAGRYKHTGLARGGNGNPLIIIGDGPNVTQLINTSATASDITLNTSPFGMNSVYIGGLSFIPSVPKTAGYAIEQTGDGGLASQGIIENIIVGGNGWGGIKITSCLDLNIRDIFITHVGANARGISLVGTLGTGFPSIGAVNSVLMQNIAIKDGTAGTPSGNGVTTAIYIGDHAVGIQGQNIIVQGGPNHIDYGFWIASTGIDITVSDYIHFENSYADVALLANLRIDGGHNVGFTGCTFQYVQGAGHSNIVINNGTNILFTGCDSHGSLRHGMSILGGSHINIIGCQFYGNSTEGGGSNVYSDIHIANSVGVGAVTISGCTFGSSIIAAPNAKYNIEVVGPSNANYVIGPNNYGQFLTAAIQDGGTIGANTGSTYKWPKAANLTGTTVTSGTYASPVIVSASIFGATRITEPPATTWGVDFTGASMILADGASSNLAAGSGLVCVTNNSNGWSAVLLLAGIPPVLIAQSPGSSFAIGPGTAGQIGVEWNGGTGYRFNNKTGTGAALQIAGFRTRTAA